MWREAGISLAPRAQKRHNGVMQKAKISDLRNHLSRYLDHVRAGGRVVVLDRNRPVALIIPVSSLEEDAGVDDGRLAMLEREGLISGGAGRVPDDLLRPTAVGRGARVLRALLEERESGR